MKEKVIKVLKIEPGKLPKVVELKNELTALQEAVAIGADYRVVMIIRKNRMPSKLISLFIVAALG